MHYYPSLSEADKDGAIARGWIPDFLPGSSRNIRETAEDSPSEEWCAFEFSANDSANLRNHLNPVQRVPQAVTHLPSPGGSWWPAVLQGTLDVQKIHAAGLELYVVERPETSVTTEILLFAIDWANGRAFFYGTRE
ncbi:MAG TPA: hypothetical protein VJO53_14450 [Candidatus Acidoferrales bacterium]|nr:hypothetical protein [Candidatus Acidoferrales bacterium]